MAFLAALEEEDVWTQELVQNSDSCSEFDPEALKAGRTEEMRRHEVYDTF